MNYQELKQMPPEKIIEFGNSIDKISSFYGEEDIRKKWDNLGNDYGGSPLGVVTFVKDGVTYVITEDGKEKPVPSNNGQFTDTILDLLMFRNPVTGFILGLLGAFEDPLKGIRGTSAPYIIKVPYKEDEEEIPEVPIEAVPSEEGIVEEIEKIVEPYVEPYLEVGEPRHIPYRLLKEDIKNIELEVGEPIYIPTELYSGSIEKVIELNDSLCEKIEGEYRALRGYNFN